MYSCFSGNEMEHFISESSYQLLTRFSINTECLNEDPTKWEGNENYQKALFLVKKNIPVTNYVAERAVKLIED